MSARTTVLASALILIGTGFAGAAPEQPLVKKDRVKVVPKTRRFSVSMVSSFSQVPKEVRSFEFWFPLPFDDSRQQIFNRYSHAPYPVEITEQPDTGNLILYMKGGARGGVPMQVRITFDVERHEDLRNAFEPPDEPIALDAEKAVAKRWLQPENYVPLDKEMKARASKIVSGRKTPLDKARAIYNFVVENMTFLEDTATTPGAGYGHAGWALSEMKGNARDLASAFVALCRAAGIPARSVTGIEIPTGTRQGTLKRYHGWAEFYLEGIGWAPADPAAGRRDPARRHYYFGALDENRLAVSVGRDIVLIPPQAGEPLNYFVNPYWQGDTKELPTPWIEITFEEIDEIPSPMITPAPGGQQR